MNFEIALIFSLTVAIAAIIGWIRFRKMDPAFYPFLLLVTAATLNEITSIIVLKFYNTNAVNINLYSLAESLLILWQFHRWKLFKHQFLYRILTLISVFVWSIEIFLISDILTFTSYFNVVYTFTIVLLSIQMINRILIRGEGRLLTHAAFLICSAFVILYTYSALIEIFWIWGLDASRSFRLNVYRIFYYINLATNLIYAFAMLWIPKKREFIVLS